MRPDCPACWRIIALHDSPRLNPQGSVTGLARSSWQNGQVCDSTASVLAVVVAVVVVVVLAVVVVMAVAAAAASAGGASRGLGVGVGGRGSIGPRRPKGCDEAMFWPG